MTFDLSLVKRHPYATGGVVIVGAILLYLAIRSRGSSGSSAEAIDTNFAGYQTGLAIASQNAQAQTAIADRNAQLGAFQVQAQLEAVKTVYGAQENIELSKTARDIAIAQIGAQTASEYIDAQKLVALDTNATNKAIAENTNQAAVDIVGLQAGTAIQLAQIDADVNKAYIEMRGDYFKDYFDVIEANSGRKANNLATIIAALQGQGPEAIQANHMGGFNFSVPGLFSFGKS